MDTQVVNITEQPASPDSKKSFFTRKKIIIGVIVLAVLAEIIWGAVTLYQSSKRTSTAKIMAPATIEQTSNDDIVALSAPSSELRVGEKITVAVNIFSSKATDGTDLVVLYDPGVLSVVLPSSSTSPVTVGSLYNSYPLNSVDTKKGRIMVSGISMAESGIVPRGVFGSIVFEALKVGTTNISFDYTPGSTVDSNIIQTGTAEDVLKGAQNLEVNVLP